MALGSWWGGAEQCVFPAGLITVAVTMLRLSASALEAREEPESRGALERQLGEGEKMEL